MRRLSRRRFVGMTAMACAAGLRAAADDPYGAVPSERQLAWHRLETYAFLHFGINTFTDKEWGYGDEDASLFNPAEFDADAIISALKAGGMTMAILTAKHHDGFCLWPTKTTEHSVRSSRWRSGRGDVVKDLSEAARRQGLKFGVYLSPWDRNQALYGKPEYIAVYREQLRELLTQYGPIQEVWHDGANGGDGYYGGAREKRTIDKRSYYDWPKTWELVRLLQPGAVIFSDVGPDLRWVGNERGFANDPCWETYDPVAPDGGAAAPGLVREKDGGTGTRNGSRWMPPECDVSIRPGWFWHANEAERVKTPAQLMDLYFRSVGRGGSLLLNVPPDRRGLIDERDAASLAAFGKMVRETFAENLAAKATVRKSNQGSRTEFTMELTMPREVTFNIVRLREQIELGQRVDQFVIEHWADSAWQPTTLGTSIGACRLELLQEPIRAARVRLRVTKAAAAPKIGEFGLFRVVAG